MKHSTKILSLAFLAACAASAMTMTTGCTSTSAEWGGERPLFDDAGKPLVSSDGTVQKVKEPVRLKSWRHWMDTRMDSATLHTDGRQIDFAINNYSAQTTTNLAHLVSSSFDGGTKLVVALGEAYVKIAGGGAQADTALNVASRVYDYFKGKGGDATKASVSTTSDNKLQVSDGSTCVECDAAGNCTECIDCAAK